MRRNPLPHACLDCGFLYRWHTTVASRGYLEVPAEQRRAMTRTNTLENATYTWGCRRDLWAPEAPSAIWTAEIAKVRYCPLFIPYEPGSDPNTHVRLARERLLRAPVLSGVGLVAFVTAGATATLTVLVLLGIRLIG
jgi:hypothetical protein